MNFIRVTAYFFVIFFSTVYPGINTFKYKWIRIEPPFKTDFTDICFDNNGNGYLVGGYIFTITGNSINAFNPAPPMLQVKKLYTRDKNNIWSTSETFSNESKFYFYNGKQWREIQNPMANHIIYIKFYENGTGWLGGDRELAYYNGKKWRFYPFPSYRGAVLNITPVNENDFIMYAAEGKVYRYLNGKYSIIQDGVNCYYESDIKEVYTLTAGKIFKIKNNLPVYHSTPGTGIGIASICVVDDNNIWACGERGTVLHWNGSKWNSTKLPTEETLSKINFFKNEGWVCGNNGLLFHYAPAIEEVKLSNNTGFTKKRVLGINTPHNNEYGVAIGDIDNDGFKDIATARLLATNRLYVNKLSDSKTRLDLAFTEESSERGIFSNENSNMNKASLFIGVSMADIDNDNDKDIYFSNLMGENKLFINTGAGKYEDVSNEKYRGINISQRTNMSVFSDVDNDGDLDLFITNEEGSNKLFSNDGTGHFTDITVEAGLISIGSGMCASFADIDNDNDPDLCIVNWAAGNKLYRNISAKGKIKFEDITKESGTQNDSYEKNNSVVFGDVDNDGDLDLFITKRKNPNRLFINNGKGVFTDKTEEMIGLDTLFSYGASISDFDNDGYQDIYLSAIGGSRFYKNISGKKFVDMTEKYNANINGYGTGNAYGDLDNDGDLDIYSAVYVDGESSILHNNINDKRFLLLDIEGTKSCRDAVGVKIWFYKSGHSGDKNFLLGYREISGGSGYCSSSSKQVHFGTGAEQLVDIVVLFPASGIKKEINKISAGSRLHLIEEEGLSGSSTLFINSTVRLLKETRTHIVLAQLFIILIILVLSIKWGRKRYKWGLKSLIIIHTVALILFFIQVSLFDKNSFFSSIILPVLSILLLSVIIHLTYERIIMVRVAAAEQQKVRKRIARDLHDELASNLSSAQIYTDVLQRRGKAGDELLDKISMLIRDSSESVADIIWNISPKNDNIENLFMKLRTMSVDLASAIKMKISITEEIENKNLVLHDNIRRNLFLIFKESFNNMVKHSGAESCSIILIEKDNEIKIAIEDTGKGICNKTFAISSAGEVSKYLDGITGNGIKNLFNRAEEIEGKLTITSIKGAGAVISVVLKMT